MVLPPTTEQNIGEEVDEEEDCEFRFKHAQFKVPQGQSHGI